MNTGSRVGVAGWPVRLWAAAMARWRTASGLGVGHAEAVATEGFAQRRPGGAQLSGGGVHTAQSLGELEGAFGFGAVRKEAAGLPAQVAGMQALVVRR
jgi:hypothetical protein